MTTLRASSISWSLLAVVAGALTLTACGKKPAETTPPDNTDAAGSADDPAGDAGGSDSAAAEFLTVDVFEETVDKKKGDVTDCYATAKETKADLAGKLTVDFTIGGDGKVSETKVDPSSTLKDDGLNKCVDDKAKTWEFPKTRDGQPMVLPYSFSFSS
jgi:hypothetical protein